MTPIVVHPKTVFEHAASPHKDIRIINKKGLKNLRDAVRAYAVSLSTTGGFTDARMVEKQLLHHKLSVETILPLCTVSQNSKS